LLCCLTQTMSAAKSGSGKGNIRSGTSINSNRAKKGGNKPSGMDREEYEYLSDFVIKSKYREHKCHKFKLASQSQVFAIMFKNKNFSENQKEEIIIGDYDDDTVENFVRLLYDEELNEQSKYSVDLLSIGHKYQATSAIQKCCDNLESNITKENVANVWLSAEMFKLPKLATAVYKFLEQNWKKKEECPGLTDLIEGCPSYVIGLCTHFNKKLLKNSRTCCHRFDRDSDSDSESSSESD